MRELLRRLKDVDNVRLQSAPNIYQNNNIKVIRKVLQNNIETSN